MDKQTADKTVSTAQSKTAFPITSLVDDDGEYYIHIEHPSGWYVDFVDPSYLPTAIKMIKAVPT